MPSLENLSQHFRDKPFIYLAIDVGESRETVRDFFKSDTITYTNLLDTETLVSALYGVRSHPIKFLIDADGKLAGKAEGYREWDTPEIKSLIQLLIK